MRKILAEHGANKYSQNGEDGVLEYLIKCLDDAGHILNKTFCEFGAADGVWLSNTRKLAEEGWGGVWIEGNAKQFEALVASADAFEGRVEVKCCQVTKENINEVVPDNLALLSIDVDGEDLQLWSAYKGAALIVVAEINGSFYPGERRYYADSGGNSYSAMIDLAEVKGYQMVCMTGNLIFIKKAFLEAIPEFAGFQGDREDWEIEFFHDGWVPVKRISEERWQQAQVAERPHHAGYQFEEGQRRWKSDYTNVFNQLGMTFYQGGKSIIEVGCAGFPALSYCEGYDEGILVEPLDTDHLKRVCAENENLRHVQAKFEEAELAPADEVWLFNVLQHVQDPSVFLKKACKLAPVVRFFEPINYPTCEYHPHTFTLDYFKRFFGAATRFFQGGTIPNFHESDCAYGSWFSPKHYTKAGKIGVLVTATWNFKNFVAQFLQNLPGFLPGYEKKVWLFNDDTSELKLSEPDKGIEVVDIKVLHKPAPLITLERYRRYARHLDDQADLIAPDILEDPAVSHLFHLDVDMHVVECGEEILAPLVAVQHPYFYKGGGSWETREKSTAFVPENLRRYYVCGGVQGGETDRWLDACYQMSQNIIDDDDREIMAVWHDESHWNRYFAFNGLDVGGRIEMLNPGYCWSAQRPMEFAKKIVAIDKELHFRETQ